MATFVLFSWPIVSIALFGWLGRERGLIWSTLVGYLILPELHTFPLPGLPDYNKYSAISLGLVLGVIIFRRSSSFDRKLKILPENKGPEIAAIWREALGLEDIDRHKSFRDLGGSERQAGLVVRRLVRIGIPTETARDVHTGATIAELSRMAPENGPMRIGNQSIGVVLYILLGLLILSAAMTVATNPETLVNGPVQRQGLTYRDFISMVSGPVIAMVPFFLALRLLRSATHQLEVVKAIVIAGVIYGLLAAFEARMSPQLNIWVYGYFQHSWVQHLRGGGFRPIVFLDHGLSVGMFLLTACLAGIALFRHLSEPVRLLYLLGGVFCFLVLLISSNLGAAMLALVFLPLVLLATRTLQVWAVATCAVFFLAYPVVWQSGVLPKDRFVEFVTTISDDRARSLQFRLDNEAQLLERALEKPLFGWGGWGRWRIFNEQGQDRTVSDGAWVITLGEQGWVGYIALFGILLLPLFFLVRAYRVKERSYAVTGMALIMAANLIYLIPNSTLSPVAWLMVGTIAGYVRWYVVEVEADEAEEETSPRAMSRHTRFSNVHTRSAPRPSAGR